MPIIWIRYRPRKGTIADGYFNCPACRRRQPALLSGYLFQPYVYGFIPGRMTNERASDDEFYRCRGCGREYADDGLHGYDFGPGDAPGDDWKCFKCGGPVPSAEVECPTCHFNFTAGRLD